MSKVEEKESVYFSVVYDVPLNSIIADVHPPTFEELFVTIGKIEINLKKDSLPFTCPLNIQTHFRVKYNQEQLKGGPEIFNYIRLPHAIDSNHPPSFFPYATYYHTETTHHRHETKIHGTFTRSWDIKISPRFKLFPIGIYYKSNGNVPENMTEHFQVNCNSASDSMSEIPHQVPRDDTSQQSIYYQLRAKTFHGQEYRSELQPRGEFQSPTFNPIRKTRKMTTQSETPQPVATSVATRCPVVTLAGARCRAENPSLTSKNESRPFFTFCWCDCSSAVE